jgi:periplasmic divalent cation tolerance protein
MDLPLLVVTTVASHEEARMLARAIVDLRLAACAQIEPIDSIYRWRGTVHAEPEFRVLFKTRAAAYDAIEAAIRERHPYELPAIHAIATTRAHAPYAAWVEECADGGGTAASPSAEPS